MAGSLSLHLYLIGAPGAGKTSVFEALTNTPQGPHFSSRGPHRLGVVKVPDPRLDALNALYRPKKCTPAEVTFVDVGLPPGTGAEGQGQGRRRVGELTAFLGEADAFVLVVQAFGEFDYRGRPLDEAAQLESVLLDLIVADLEAVERRLHRLAQERRKGSKEGEAEAELLERCKAQLESEGPLRALALSAEEEVRLRGFRFLSQKPALVVANVAEERLTPTLNLSDDRLEALRRAAERHGLKLLTLCAPLEAEIAQLEPEAQAEFSADYGLDGPARVRLIRAVYEALDLISFFTVNPNEVRAWTVRRGTVAQQAAGKVHTDMERGFIRAETVACQELLDAGSWAACRQRGTLRLEGKTYEVADGDVILFRFNV